MAGAWTVTFPAPAVKLRNWKRWFMSFACVTDGEEIRETFAICAALGVVTSKLVPIDIADGAPVIVGRAPLKRYGGE